jgi:hypothetical protein
MHVIRVYSGLVWSITTIYGSQNPDLRQTPIMLARVSGGRVNVRDSSPNVTER